MIVAAQMNKQNTHALRKTHEGKPKVMAAPDVCVRYRFIRILPVLRGLATLKLR